MRLRERIFWIVFPAVSTAFIVYGVLILMDALGGSCL